MLTGHPPVLVALVGALAVMFVTLTFTNGVGAQTLAGALGISITPLLTTAVGVLAVHAIRLDGAGTDLSTLLAEERPGVSLEGVLLAGMVIGALGVLADTAVTQASAVMSLRHTAPRLGPGALYRRAVSVGRDHLSATIHTLVLAYAGTALPLLLVLGARDATLLDTVNQVDIVEPIVAGLVGCAGLIAAVPLTTGLAALLIARIPADTLPSPTATCTDPRPPAPGRATVQACAVRVPLPLWPARRVRERGSRFMCRRCATLARCARSRCRCSRSPRSCHRLRSPGRVLHTQPRPPTRSRSRAPGGSAGAWPGDLLPAGGARSMSVTSRAVPLP